ncbi:hypothetical protein BC828DRAFT_384023 [Blastocladiella britannica]|nr:hypothetical protein BC828DRAFT_384023 [Blastocladiella britannica]
MALHCVLLCVLLILGCLQIAAAAQFKIGLAVTFGQNDFATAVANGVVKMVNASLPFLEAELAQPLGINEQQCLSIAIWMSSTKY